MFTKIIKYFDLNKGIIQNAKNDKELSITNGEMYYIDDITIDKTNKKNKKSLKSLKLSLTKQLILYVGVLLGVLSSSAVNQFKSGNPLELKISLPALIISIIVAFMIIPQIYEKIKLDISTPLIVQFGLCVQNGVFWHVTFNAIGKAI